MTAKKNQPKKQRLNLKINKETLGDLTQAPKTEEELVARLKAGQMKAWTDGWCDLTLSTGLACRAMTLTLTG